MRFHFFIKDSFLCHRFDKSIITLRVVTRVENVYTGRFPFVFTSKIAFFSSLNVTLGIQPCLKRLSQCQIFRLWISKSHVSLLVQRKFTYAPQGKNVISDVAFSNTWFKEVFLWLCAGFMFNTCHEYVVKYNLNCCFCAHRGTVVLYW